MRIVIIVITLIICVGCTRFQVSMQPDGTQVVNTWGAPLLSRADKFTVKHEWLDASNVLHETTIDRNTEERADYQYKALDRLISLLEKLYLERAANSPPKDNK